MKITLYGATGMIGQRILNEALARGHQVKAIVRDPAKLSERAGLTVVKGDIFDGPGVALNTLDQDAIVCAFAPPQEDLDALSRAVRTLVENSSTSRTLFVGGAGTLYVAPGQLLVDSPQLPEAWRAIARAHASALDLLKREGTKQNWTSLSPAGLIEPGARTGKFRLTTDDFLVDEQGQSRITAEDYAVALINEVETGDHPRMRIGVAY